MRFDPATSEGLTSNLDPLGHQKDVEEGRRKPPTHSLMGEPELAILHTSSHAPAGRHLWKRASVPTTQSPIHWGKGGGGALGFGVQRQSQAPKLMMSHRVNSVQERGSELLLPSRMFLWAEPTSGIVELSFQSNKVNIVTVNQWPACLIDTVSGVNSLWCDLLALYMVVPPPLLFL